MLDTQELGPTAAGSHDFEWPAGKHSDAEGLRFRITASSGSTTLSSTPLMLDRVESVSAGGDSLMLQLQRSGSVAYGDVKTVH